VALEVGNVGEFAEADEIFEDTFFFQGKTHLPSRARWVAISTKDTDGQTDDLVSTQTPHYIHSRARQSDGKASRGLSVIATPTGGGFGGKT